NRFCYFYGHPRHLHSFPTRRSSDLAMNTALERAQLRGYGPPTPRQADVLVAISRYIAEHGFSPTVRELVALLGLGRRSAVAILRDRKSTRLNSSHVAISYAVFCLKK